MMRAIIAAPARARHGRLQRRGAAGLRSLGDPFCRCQWRSDRPGRVERRVTVRRSGGMGGRRVGPCALRAGTAMGSHAEDWGHRWPVAHDSMTGTGMARRATSRHGMPARACARCASRSAARLSGPGVAACHARSAAFASARVPRWAVVRCARALRVTARAVAVLGRRAGRGGALGRSGTRVQASRLHVPHARDFRARFMRSPFGPSCLC